MTKKTPKNQPILIDLSKEPATEMGMADRATIARFNEKCAARSSAPKLKLEQEAGSPPSLSYDGENLALTVLALMESFGTTSAIVHTPKQALPRKNTKRKSVSVTSHA